MSIPEEYGTIDRWLQAIANNFNNPLQEFLMLLKNWDKISIEGKETVKANILTAIDLTITDLNSLRSEVDGLYLRDKAIVDSQVDIKK